MKNLIFFLTLIIGSNIVAFAQEKVPMVDSKGHMYYDQKQIGSISTTGGMDMSGHAVTKIDKNGNVVDSTGKAIGKLSKGNTFQYYVDGKAKNLLFQNRIIMVCVLSQTQRVRPSCFCIIVINNKRLVQFIVQKKIIA